MQLFLKILSGMANSVDPDQTAPKGVVLPGSALFAYVILSEALVYGILRHLLYISIFWLKKTKKKTTKKPSNDLEL